MNNGGDQLARGNVRAQFSPAEVSESRWKEIFGEENYRKLNAMSQEDREKLQQEAIAEVEKIEQQAKPAPVKFRAVQDRIIVTRFEESEKVGGLFVPDESKEKPAKGVVVAVGPGKWVNGSLQKPSVEVGEKVAFGKFSGAEIQIGFEHFLVLREEDLFLVEE